MIVARDLARRFGPVHAVRGVSFSIPPGQIVGILGPNGAGKTTTIRMITGLLPPSDGEVTLDGLDCLTQSARVRARVGYMPENTPLYPEMRVEQYLAYRASIHRLGRAARKARETVLERCALADMRRRRIATLSRGYRQRVGLAAALIHSPPVLILDEPTSGLDPAQIAHTRGLIRSLAGRQTVLLVSHILPEVEKTCDRILVFARGRLLADGSPRELIDAAPRAGSLVVEVRAPSAEALRAALQPVAGLRRIETLPDAQPGIVRANLEVDAGARAQAAEAVAAACAGAGMALRELRRASATLEEAYAAILESAPADDPTESPEAPHSPAAPAAAAKEGAR